MAEHNNPKTHKCKYRIYKDRSGREHCIIACSDSPLKCEKCGWNPAVEKKRKEKIFAEKGLVYAD